MSTTTAPSFNTVESTESRIEGVIIRAIPKYDDDRGWLTELFRVDELPPDNCPAMAYVSETNPGVTRGPHEHVDQSDLFAFIGPGNFKLYLWDEREDSPTYRTRQTAVFGSEYRAAVVIPPGVVHAYRCVSETPGWVFNAPNALYAGDGKTQPVDEIRHEEIEDSPYILD